MSEALYDFSIMDSKRKENKTKELSSKGERNHRRVEDKLFLRGNWRLSPQQNSTCFMES